jgi:hypothetical protein
MSIDRSTALRFLAAGLAGLTISVFAPGIDGPLWAAILPAMIMASAIGVVAVQPRFRAQAAVTYLGMLAVTEAVQFVTVSAATHLSPVNELSGRLTVAAHLAILTAGWVIAALVTATGFTYTWARRQRPHQAGRRTDLAA